MRCQCRPVVPYEYPFVVVWYVGMAVPLRDKERFFFFSRVAIVGEDPSIWGLVVANFGYEERAWTTMLVEIVSCLILLVLSIFEQRSLGCLISFGNEGGFNSQNPAPSPPLFGPFASRFRTQILSLWTLA